MAQCFDYFSIFSSTFSTNVDFFEIVEIHLNEKEVEGKNVMTVFVVPAS